MVMPAPGAPASDSQPGARLQTFWPAWQSAPKTSRTTLRRGFHWTWISSPPSLYPPLLSPGDPSLLPQVQELLQKKAIYEVAPQPCLLSRIFSIPKTSGGQRLVIDLSYLNSFIHAPSFKMTNHTTLASLITPPAWAASLDLQDAYLHIPIRANLHKFLAFSHGNRLFFFRALPFGLNVAPAIFTYLLRHPLSLLHQEGVQVLAYLDDWVTWAPSPTLVRRNVSLTLKLLTQLGFLVNNKKSHLEPTTELTWLGVRWFLEEGLWDVTLSLKTSICTAARRLLRSQSSTRREWESFVGKLTFLGQIHKHLRPLIAPLARPQLLSHSSDRDTRRTLPNSLLSALHFWCKDSSVPPPQPFLAPSAKISLWTDASSEAWGAHTDRGQEQGGRWSPQEQALHINALELLAVSKALHVFSISNCQVSLMIDNETARSIINKQTTRSSTLLPLLQDLVNLCHSRRISLSAYRIPSSLNILADALSRIHPVPTEWTLPDEVFQTILQWHGPLQVDLMATRNNSRLPHFVSPLPHPEASGIDVLQTNWARWTQIYLFPPKNFLLRILPLLQKYPHHGVIIAPWHPSAPWFPYLIQRTTKHLHVHLPLFQIVQGESINSGSSVFERWTAFSF